MSTHHDAHPISQDLCNRLFEELNARLGSVTRRSGGSVCSIGPEHAARTIYVYHHKAPSIRVYFRGDPDEVVVGPSTISIHARPTFEDSWEKRFPFHFNLWAPAVAADAAAFLAARTATAPQPRSPVPRRPTREQRAAKAWDVLAPRATARRTITYAELAAAIGTHHRSLGRPLGLIQDYCLSEGLPPLTIIVVHSSDARPGVGFIGWDASDRVGGMGLVHSIDWTSLPNPFGYAYIRAGTARQTHSPSLQKRSLA